MEVLQEGSLENLQEGSRRFYRRVPRGSTGMLRFYKRTPWNFYRRVSPVGSTVAFSGCSTGVSKRFYWKVPGVLRE